MRKEIQKLPKNADSQFFYSFFAGTRHDLFFRHDEI